ncbi:hypothetical protein NQ315_016435 [Exocentrus adspersus]|uniref:5'-3' exoribonuclease 1 n=1 Tax=Exocentrus adspersus TaxID=1586481 RepID=A0AAV8VQ60_9CUCU|nr:hypothetical protein NQ315_016435 [Exocentrus adspersus]
MGVPKFFRYISERYPCLSELVKEYQIPEFDNLYLDMNGIIHMCSHPDDNNPHFRITEEKIFKDIFHYIEVLFRMIRPQKLFFMAVDGVAPRAKMNQQRGRRFRSAKDAERQETEALNKGETLPEEARFDSNCITPGTVFMARLHEQLKYFVVNKISTDPTWQGCKVILSGHEASITQRNFVTVVVNEMLQTPGEGEHKIMDYIRYMRAQPGYDPNTRHCLYGLDADLIMLGLCTHEPHFSLLREEVKFGRKSTKRASVPEEITFYLLHLSLMREYLELEFAPLKNKLSGFQYDFEKNYRRLGYINEAGTLNLVRFDKFMQKLGDIDLENFEEVQDDLLYMEAKTGRKYNPHSKVSSKNLVEWDGDGAEAMKLEPLEPEKKPRDSGMLALINATDDLLLDDENDEEETDHSDEDGAFECYKRDYYMNKLEYTKVTPQVLRDQAEGYVRAIQWNLNYYYNGCCSWSWFYPHHYAPYISDIKGFSNLKIEFDKGKPFLPYEQLLAVLPSASRNLLPECYHSLMTEENSIIKKYYPEEFQTDLNGKKQEWEAVVLVPFIDENILLDAMRSCNDQLTAEEKQRNTHGPMLVYKYTADNKGPYPAPEYFPPVPENHTELVKMRYDEILLPKEKLIKGAYPGVLMDIYYPGFPTMKHLHYKSEVRKAKVRVFEQPSRNENMIISIINDRFPDEKIPVDLIGSTVWVGWPHLVEAKVVSISNSKLRYQAVEGSGYNAVDQTDEQVRQWQLEINGITEYYRNRMGIEVGNTKVLMQVQVMTGRKYIFSSQGRLTLEKIFTKNTSCYPLQSVVVNIITYDSHQSTYKNIKDVFPIGCTCFMLTNPYYGSQGVVQDSTESLKNGRVKVSITVFDEPNLSSIKEMHAKKIRSYRPAYHVAAQLGMAPSMFSRITGSIFLSARNGEGGLKNVNVGLDLKLNKKMKETPGYTKKVDTTWLYTDKAVDLVAAYIDRYPEVIDYLSRDERFDEINVESIWKDNWEEKLKELQSWLKSLPLHSIERQTCGSSALEPELVEELEKIVDRSLKSVGGKKIAVQVKPNFLYRSEIQSGTLPPDPKAETRVLDRIINVRSGFSVPLGLKGTVIAVQESTSDTERDTMYDVVFDKPFSDGMKLNCSENRGYRLPQCAFINISYGQRLMEQKTGRPGTQETIARAESSQRYSNPRSEQLPWFPKQRSQPLPLPQMRPPFQKENSAFAQFSSTNKPPHPEDFYNANTNRQQEFYNNGNRPLRQQNYNQRGEEYSPQRNVQQRYRNGSNADVNRGLTQRNDFMPNFHVASNEECRRQPKPQTQQQKQSQSQESPQKQRQNPNTVNVDILKTILKIGKNRDERGDKKEEVKVGSKPMKGNARNVQQQPLSTRQEHPIKVENAGNDLFNIFAEAAKAPASVRLLTYYQSNSLGLPRYQYFNAGKLIQSQINLANGEFVVGEPAETREEASENVAAKVLDMFLKQGKPSQTHVQASPPKGPVARKSTQNEISSNQQKDSLHTTKTKVLNNSFVPLQAIKSHINKTSSNNPNKETASEGSLNEASQRQDNRETSNRNHRHRGKNHNGNTQNRNRQRKTRIAANFDLLKTTSASPDS